MKFQFRSEEVVIEGYTFVLSEPSTAAMEAMAKSEGKTDFLSLCVTHDGSPVNSAELPWRIGGKLHEALGKFTSAGNESA